MNTPTLLEVARTALMHLDSQHPESGNVYHRLRDVASKLGDEVEIPEGLL